MAYPDLIEYNDNWEEYIDFLYSYYEDFIVNAGIEFNRLPLRTRYKPATDGKGYGFWHVISSGEIENEREIDFRRCERISYISYWVNNAQEPPSDIYWWKNKRGTDTHIVIANDSTKYIVILAERNGYYLLKTAYKSRSRRYEQLKTECKKYWENPW